MLAWATLLVGAPTDMPPSRPSVVTGPLPVVLIILVRRTLATAITELRRTRFITHKSWEVRSTPGATQQGCG